MIKEDKQITKVSGLLNEIRESLTSLTSSTLELKQKLKPFIKPLVAGEIGETIKSEQNHSELNSELINIINDINELQYTVLGISDSLDL